MVWSFVCVLNWILWHINICWLINAINSSGDLEWVVYFWRSGMNSVLLEIWNEWCTSGNLEWVVYFWWSGMNSVLLEIWNEWCTSGDLEWVVYFWRSGMNGVLLEIWNEWCTSGDLEWVVYYSQFQSMQQKSHQRDKCSGCLPRKILGIGSNRKGPI